MTNTKRMSEPTNLVGSAPCWWEATTKPTLDSPESLVREYEGKDLEKIGKHLPDISSYNYNFYCLPNGTIVLLVSDDDNCSDVFVVNGLKQSLVGIQYDGGVFEIGDFS